MTRILVSAVYNDVSNLSASAVLRMALTFIGK